MVKKTIKKVYIIKFNNKQMGEFKTINSAKKEWQRLIVQKRKNDDAVKNNPYSNEVIEKGEYEIFESKQIIELEETKIVWIDKKTGGTITLTPPEDGDNG